MEIVDPTLEFGPRPAEVIVGVPSPRQRRFRGHHAALLLGVCGVVLLAMGLRSFVEGPDTPVDGRAHGQAESCPPPLQVEDAPNGSPLVADILGVGCPQRIEWRAPILVVRLPTGAVRRYRLGRAGDQLLVGRFACAARPVLARYRPSNGEVVVYPPLSAALTAGSWLEPEPSGVAVRGGVAKVSVGADGCERVSVSPTR